MDLHSSFLRRTYCFLGKLKSDFPSFFSSLLEDELSCVKSVEEKFSSLDKGNIRPPLNSGNVLSGASPFTPSSSSILESEKLAAPGC